MIEVAAIGATMYMLVALVAFGTMAIRPAAGEFRPLRALAAALAWLPALVYVQTTRRTGGETDP
mgnify:CR=1 FL=1